MAKILTPEMEKINARRMKRNKGKAVRSTPMTDAWRRLIRNRTAILGMAIIVLLFLTAIFAPLIAPYMYDEMDVLNMLKGPSSAHWFGTDNLGRDMFSRCVYGARITLPIAIFTVAAAVLTGGTLGVLCAFFGGQFDMIVMRILDVWGSIPGLMLSIAIVAALGNNMYVLVIGLSVGAVPNMARTFRGAIFTVVDSDYVEASRSIGASNFSIMFKHLLPNAVGPVILAVVGLLGVEVLCVSTLSFLGVGVQPPTPEWGSLLSTSKEFLNTASYLCTFPGIFIVLSVLGFNLLGDGLRDALDPRLK
ncbi:MAG: ABC transporter permease [Lachnospiraceae bacterium]|nr:ABC transporter permease [Lachnospiraceae bacterium]